MAKDFEGAWICYTTNCGYIYVPSKGDRKGKIPPGTPFEELPEDWRCPVCGASKKLSDLCRKLRRKVHLNPFDTWVFHNRQDWGGF